MKVYMGHVVQIRKNQQQRRINFALENFSYIVVIAENQRGFDLVTVYYVEMMHRGEKLKKEFESFVLQKKRAPLFRRGPKLLLHMVDEQLSLYIIYYQNHPNINSCPDKNNF